jgi:hypothetical protein
MGLFRPVTGQLNDWELRNTEKERKERGEAPAVYCIFGIFRKFDTCHFGL